MGGTPFGTRVTTGRGVQSVSFRPLLLHGVAVASVATVGSEQLAVFVRRTIVAFLKEADTAPQRRRTEP